MACLYGAGVDEKTRIDGEDAVAVAETNDEGDIDVAPRARSSGGDDEVDDGEPHGHGDATMGSRWPQDRQKRGDDISGTRFRGETRVGERNFGG